MPTHTIASGLIKLYSCNGAPWEFKNWKDITHIEHGLFNEDDALLPRGWDRRTADRVEAYFDQFSKLPNEALKMAFAAGKKEAATNPGRQIWRSFVTTGWKAWGINTIISKVLTENEFHPLQIMIADANATNDLVFPQGEHNVPLVLDLVALALFGEEAMNTSGRLLQNLRGPLTILVQRFWDNARKTAERSRRNLDKLENKALDAFEGATYITLRWCSFF